MMALTTQENFIKVTIIWLIAGLIFVGAALSAIIYSNGRAHEERDEERRLCLTLENEAARGLCFHGVNE